MPVLSRWSTPAGLADPDPRAWSDAVSGLLSQYVARFPQFYDRTEEDTPRKTPAPMVSWAAFPARLRGPDRFEVADADRNEQDEYCEWSVERKRGKISRITFTTELPEYYEHLLATDEKALLRLYRKLVGPGVELAHLRDSKGRYRRENRWNTSQPGRIAHLMQGNNSLGAAVDLVARATEQRIDAQGKPVRNQQQLVQCAGLGNPFRHSDPQIAGAVNDAARGGAELSFGNPPGLHLGRPITAGMVTPDGADPDRFWKIERGDAENTLRARFEVPASKKYTVGDIKIGGKPIRFGGQVAQRVQVWVRVVVKPGTHKPKPKRCGE
jgi:hypothetical protein